MKLVCVGQSTKKSLTFLVKKKNVIKSGPFQYRGLGIHLNPRSKLYFYTLHWNANGSFSKLDAPHRNVHSPDRGLISGDRWYLHGQPFCFSQRETFRYRLCFIHRTSEKHPDPLGAKICSKCRREMDRLATQSTSWPSKYKRRLQKSNRLTGSVPVWLAACWQNQQDLPGSVMYEKLYCCFENIRINSQDWKHQAETLSAGKRADLLIWRPWSFLDFTVEKKAQLRLICSWVDTSQGGLISHSLFWHFLIQLVIIGSEMTTQPNWLACTSRATCTRSESCWQTHKSWSKCRSWLLHCVIAHEAAGSDARDKLYLIVCHLHSDTRARPCQRQTRQMHKCHL